MICAQNKKPPDGSGLTTGQKMVLASLPTMITYRFGVGPKERPIVNIGGAFMQMDNGPNQGVDLQPIHDAVILLAKNGGRSFHLTNAAGKDGGIAITHIDGTFLAGIGGQEALCASFTGGIGRLNRRSRDRKRVQEEVTRLQNLFAEKWILENPNEVGAYMKDIPTAPETLHPGVFQSARALKAAKTFVWSVHHRYLLKQLPTITC